MLKLPFGIDIGGMSRTLLLLLNKIISEKNKYPEFQKYVRVEMENAKTMVDMACITLLK